MEPRCMILLFAIFAVANCEPLNVGWWKSAVIYEIYPRSFLSANNNQWGTGDLNGIISKADYIKSLGVDAVWLNPVYPAKSDADAGYDISDFRDIDPQFGTLNDFKNLVKVFKEKGLRVIMDYVPNHSSNKHDWFIRSENGEDKYKDYYVWRDPGPSVLNSNNTRQPPNNWLSAMSGSAWEWSDKRGQFYLHQFLIEQPDLNYTNPDLMKEMTDILEYWMDLGVDGFRMDAVFSIMEDPLFRNEPPMPGVKEVKYYDDLNHIYTAEFYTTYNVLREFRKTLDNYTKRKNTTEKIMFTESYTLDLNKILKYYGTEKEPIAHFPFNFFFIQNTTRKSTGADWGNVINTWFKYINPDLHWPNWVIGNHDRNRMSSRYSEEHADLIQMLMMTLKGTTFLYAGDEMALQDSYVRRDEAQDKAGIRAPPEKFDSQTRDPERGPIPWNDTDNGGFSKTKPWLPMTSDPKKFIQANLDAPKSHLKVVRPLIKLKKLDTIKRGAMLVETVNKTNSDILLITRSLPDNPTIISVLNFGVNPVVVDLRKYRKTLPDEVYVYASSVNSQLMERQKVKTDDIFLPPVGGAVVVTSHIWED